MIGKKKAKRLMSVISDDITHPPRRFLQSATRGTAF
jgi:hypothetical protein